MGPLDGRLAVVTGAARGIGRAIAEELARAGARVIIADVLVEEAEAVVRSIGQLAAGPSGHSARFVRLDVTDEAGWAALVGQLATDPPDALVNNAGGLLDPRPLLEADVATWRSTLDLNLTSAFLGMRAVLPLMLERGRGSIVNVCSVSGVTGQPDAPAYQAAKAGVLMLTRNAALTYGPHGVRVNALTPSVVSTPGLEQETDERLETFLRRVPLGRAAEPSEIGRAARFLVSDDAAYVNGANLAVDGGYLA